MSGAVRRDEAGTTHTVGEACGKAILLGEHFVVHGIPALAIPLPGLRTRVEVARGRSPDITIDADIDDTAPVLEAVRRAGTLVGCGSEGLRVRSRSEVPLGCGLGSSAAFAVALVRALRGFVGAGPDPRIESELAFELERIAHGTPSGVDNTVVAFGRAIVFQRGTAPELLSPRGSLTLVVADSGKRHPTSEAVARVHAFAASQPVRFAEACEQVRRIVADGSSAFVSGDAATLGPRMDANQVLLREVGVSSPMLDRLVDAAKGASALGAKLTGAGVGGSVVALCEAEGAGAVRDALLTAGARSAFVNHLGEP